MEDLRIEEEVKVEQQIIEESKESEHDEERELEIEEQDQSCRSLIVNHNSQLEFEASEYDYRGVDLENPEYLQPQMEDPYQILYEANQKAIMNIMRELEYVPDEDEKDESIAIEALNLRAKKVSERRKQNKRVVSDKNLSKSRPIKIVPRRKK